MKDLTKAVNFLIFSASLVLKGIHGFSDLPMDAFLPAIISVNDSFLNCPHVMCDWIEELGPPPDWLPPPPPLPLHLKQILVDNQSIDERDGCNFCHVFSNPQDSELILQKPDMRASDSWFSLLVASVLGSAFFGILLVLLFIKWKKWKLLPPSSCGADSCPVFPKNILNGHKAAPAPCSPSDVCISPVVNEKSPQSIITSCPGKGTIRSNYWRRNEGSLTHSGSIIDPGATEIVGYTGVPRGERCTSSPVYAELDSGGVSINHSQIPASMLIGQPQTLSPYVVHTYSEVDAMRMAALLPDASYDNVAYLPSSNSDHYQGRSLRRQRASQLSQLGSTTPLLSNQSQQNFSSPINYLSSGRISKKPRPPYGHTTSRANSRNLLQEVGSIRSTGSRRAEGLYQDLPVQSPSLSTFRVPHALNFHENPKRPLPPVPGIRL